MEAILVFVTGPWVSQSFVVLYGFICSLKRATQGTYIGKNQSNKSRWETKKVQFCDSLQSYLLQVGLWNQLVGCQQLLELQEILHMSQLIFSFSPQWSLAFCSLFLHAAALCSSADFQPLDLSCWLLFVLSFSLLLCLKYLNTLLSKEDLVTAQGRSASQSLPLFLHFFQNGFSHTHWKQAVDTSSHHL